MPESNQPPKIPLEKHYRAMRRAQAAGDQEAMSVIQGRIEQEIRNSRQADVESIPAGERFVAGIGRGLENVGLNVADIAGRVPGLGVLRPSKETWSEFKEASDPLLATTAGSLGNFTGEMAATLPIGGLAGAGAKALAVKTGSRLLAPLAAGVGKTALEGAVIGGVLGGPEERLSGAATGAIGGAALHGAGKLVASGAKRLVNGVVKATPAARYLQSKGVNLTIGQMNPESLLAQAEEISMSTPLRAVTAGQRRAGMEAWQDAVLNEARAPGAAKLPSKAAVADKLAQAREGFGPAYDAAIEGQQIGQATHLGKGKWLSLRSEPGTNVKNGLAEAVGDKRILATDAERKMVGEFLENELSVLPKSASRKVSAARIQALRSGIREKIRDTDSGPVRQMLKKAESAVSDVLEGQLPEGNAAALKAADAAYGKHRIVSDAVRRSKDMPSGITPSKLSEAVASATEGRAYEVGGGGELRRLAAAGRDSLEGRIPITGARLLGAGPLSLVSPLLNLAPAKAALTGTLKSQMRARALMGSVNRKLGHGGRRTLSEAESLAIAALTGRKGE